MRDLLSGGRLEWLLPVAAAELVGQFEVPDLGNRVRWDRNRDCTGNQRNENRSGRSRADGGGDRAAPDGARLRGRAWDRSAKAAEARDAQGQRGLRVVQGPRARWRPNRRRRSSIITEDKGVRHFFAGPTFPRGRRRGQALHRDEHAQPMGQRELHRWSRPRARASSIPWSWARSRRARGQAAGAARRRGRRRRARAGGARPLTRRIVHIGPNGAGCAMKLAVNLGMAVYLQSLDRGVALGRSEGLALDQMLEIFAEAPTASPWLKGKTRRSQGRARRHHPRYPHHAQGRNVCDRHRRAQRRRDAGHVRHAGLALGGRRRRLGEKDLAEVPRYFREFMLQVYD